MSGLFQTFNVAKSGMQVQQTAINTTSHNIANASTEGYSRQRVNLSTTIPNNLPGIGQVGTGVEIDSIIRTRDGFLDSQVRYENSINGKFESSQMILDQVEIIFLEPSDTGLNTVMNEMWTTWQELSKSPENSNARTVVAQNALTFTDTLNHMMIQLDAIVEDTVSLSESKVYDMNAILSQINTLNDQICRAKLKDIIPNDLMDERDLQLDKLSKIININCQTTKLGSIEISLKETGEILLDSNSKVMPEINISVIRDVQPDGAGAFTVTVAKNGNIDEVITFASSTTFRKGDIICVDPNTWETNPELTKPNLISGELLGQMESIDVVMKYQDKLNRLAESLVTSINIVHSDNCSGANFFSTSDGSVEINARNVTVNTAILDDIQLINAGRTQTSPAGDGSRALAIAQLRNATFVMNDIAYFANNYDEVTMRISSTSAGTSFDNYYKDIVAKVGIDVQKADKGTENQGNLLLQLEQRRESISGVSIDEEVANLIQLQTAYQANARVMNTITEMLDTLINRLGL